MSEQLALDPARDSLNVANLFLADLAVHSRRGVAAAGFGGAPVAAGGAVGKDRFSSLKTRNQGNCVKMKFLFTCSLQRS